MSVNEFGPVDVPKDRLTLLEEAVACFDSSETLYFNACGDYFERPKKPAYDTLAAAVDHHSNAFRKLVEVVAQDAPAKEVLLMCTNLIRNADGRRSDFLNAITGEAVTRKLSDDFAFADPEEFDDEANEDGQKGELVSQAWTIFKDLLHGDTDSLQNASLESPAAKKIDQRNAIGRHALHIGEIALGTFIGFWAARKLGDK